MPLFATQPLKAIYATYAIFSTLLQLPFVAFCYLFPRFRPHPEWTFRQALTNSLLRSFLYHGAVLRLKTPPDLNPGSLNERYVTIPPSSRPVYKSILTSQPTIKPVSVGATWYPSPPPTSNNGSLTILHFHGGGYVIGSTRTDAVYIGNILSTQVGTRALIPDYRLSSNPLGHFPAALQDAVSSYVYLLDTCKIPASQIIVSGDSAGGHLAISLLRYISETEELLPSPRAALLWSPPVDIVGMSSYLTQSSASKPSSSGLHINAKTDYLDDTFLSWSVSAFSDGGNVDIKDQYLTQLGSPFKTGAKIWLHIGGLERLAKEGLEWAEEMKGEGNQVEVFVEKLANHDIVYLGNITGFEKEAEKAAKAAGQYVR